MVFDGGREDVRAKIKRYTGLFDRFSSSPDGIRDVEKPKPQLVGFNAEVENLLVMLKNEVIRLSHDPFAILGFVVMLGGVYVVFDYGENLIFGVNTAGE